ncbi:MAG: hypothetical protein COA74_12500 [Gammaproteobacteria bacterium]|nr:MAG: hypothetical protein COA74_12500 [Gammaproteobacteria bacterium]
MLKVILSISFFACCVMIISSCASQKVQTNASPPSEESKDYEQEQERGFDPCLVNPKLPACKKKNE